MKKIITIICILFSTSVYAQLRGVNLGDRCDVVWKVEEQLGSYISLETIENRVVYEGIAYGKNAFIVYDCVKEIIRSQSIMIKAEEIDTALHSLENIKEALVAKYGVYKSATEKDISGLLEKGILRDVAFRIWGYLWEVSPVVTINLNLQPENNKFYYVVIFSR